MPDRGALEGKIRIRVFVKLYPRVGIAGQTYTIKKIGYRGYTTGTYAERRTRVYWVLLVVTCGLR